MTDREINNRLRFLLTGDDGSVGDSDERAHRATKDWYERRGFSTGQLLEMIRGHLVGWKTSERIWHGRFLQTWQADLEAHVANYREPAPKMPCLEIMEQTAAKIASGNQSSGRWIELRFNAGHVEWRPDPIRSLDREWKECFYSDLDHTVKLAAIHALEAAGK